MRDIITLVNEGTLGGKAYALSLENEGLKMVYNPGFDLPADVKALGDAAAKGIVDGTVTIGVGGK